MSLRLFFLSTMYQGNLDDFRRSSDLTESLSYKEHNELLLNNTTEFVGSYSKTFTRLGYEVGCTIANYPELQAKWRRENSLEKIDEKETLYNQIRAFSPEVLWIDNIGYADSEWIGKIRTNIRSIRIILCYHCSPFNPAHNERLKHFDFMLTCTPGLKDYFERQGCKVYLFYHAFDTDILNRLGSLNNNFKNDLVFTGSLMTGSGFHQARHQLIENIIKSDIKIALYANLENQYRIKTKQALHIINSLLKRTGLENPSEYFPFLRHGSEPVRNYSAELLSLTKQPVFGLDMFRLLRQSRIVLNFHIDVASNYAGNMRLFESTGVGSCLLTDNKINIGDLFIPGQEILVYDSIDDCIDKAKWLLDNESERQRIASAGQEKTLSVHTVENRCRQIMNIFEQ